MQLLLGGLPQIIRKEPQIHNVGFFQRTPTRALANPSAASLESLLACVPTLLSISQRTLIKRE